MQNYTFFFTFANKTEFICIFYVKKVRECLYIIYNNVYTAYSDTAF